MESDNKSDFFKGGFEGFPRQLPENCVEYVLVLIDQHMEMQKLLSELEHVRKLALQKCAELTKDYIWQRDSFQLQIKSKDGLRYLHGITNYGDSVEDEWLIVFVIRELTRSRNDLWAQVTDSDGEFLLIEAADAVPKWLSPEVDSNRAWINQGQLKLITLEASRSEKRALLLTEAVQALQSSQQLTTHSAQVEEEAFYRLKKYPQQIADALHYSVLTVPRKLAHMIDSRPTVIAAAVEAFYARNPVSMKPLVSAPASAHFPPEDLVSVSIKFTKVLFAQLKSQQFASPASWAKVIQAAEAKAEQDETTQRELVRLEMGMKLTSGYEMLANSAGAKDSRLLREFAILLEDLETDIEQEGATALPTDAALKSWAHAGRDDDESWLDINFEDFEHELGGRKSKTRGRQSGFGSASTHADLQKIVSRFESFMNDETAGIDGAELEDMDEDDDPSSDQDTGSEDEDAGVEFDEAQFARMMRDMMGIASGEVPRGDFASKRRSQGTQSFDSQEADDREIRELSAQIQAELNEHGALKLGQGTPKVKTLKNGAKVEGDAGGESEEESDGDVVDVDYNLAKNLLESFKSQAGLAGPAGNILGMLGMQLPRDEQDDLHEDQKRNPLARTYTPRSETERALVDSIKQLEVQCKERIDLLEALRLSRQDDTAPSAATAAESTDLSSKSFFRKHRHKWREPWSAKQPGLAHTTAAVPAPVWVFYKHALHI
ncbi:SGT1 protein-domain-containing protein [Microdochium bolleyi]|uniref:SGT1 protein-domain-containing protein n=1 Tax=Microdochium bolleyi TaxID=196109 RepID=A0A136J0D3_9PEZI|nr:SGT1 protein-domain-containing protein [Microdochium bolleyi]